MQKKLPANRIFVDQEKECILLPIFGVLVPFHISMIKSVSKNDDSLRINFTTPILAAAAISAGTHCWPGRQGFVCVCVYVCVEEEEEGGGGDGEALLH